MRSTITVEKLNDIWNGLFLAFENEVDESFKDTKKKMYNAVIESINKDERITEFDEQIFSYYEKIIGYYIKVAEIYDEKKNFITAGKIKEMLDGLISVIKSRISQFEEICTYSSDFANPIYTEKKKILESCEREFFRQTDEIKKDFINNSANICDTKAIIYLNLNDIFNKYYIDKVYDIYENAVKKIISMLNDTSKRTVLSAYFEILKEERELLSGVINVQAEALENQKQTESETEIIQGILLYLREAYQHITKNVDTLINVFSSPESKRNICFADKKIFIKTKESNDDIFGTKKDEIYHKRDMFIKSLRDFVVKLAYERIKEETKRTEDTKLAAQNDILTAESFITYFSNITKYLEEHTKVKNSIFKKIIGGIDETIKIKTESISENTRILNDTLNDYIKNNSDIPSKLTKEQKDEIAESALTVWIESGGFNEDNIDEIFLTGTTMPEIIKKHERLRRFIKNEMLKFKREQLLFELTTFEEIMNYSVLRLRGSENEDIEGYVKCIDDNTNKIKKVLAQNGIDIINPLPHDKFNAKLHEVVVAEKNGDFTKGEIIRKLTSGYSQGDTVIIRANVVAAK